MARAGVSGALCPECGSRKTRCIGTGYTDEGYRLRRRRCTECVSPSFLTVEVVVAATWGELETSYRTTQREYYRRKQHYQGRIEMARSRPPATLLVKVKVIRPQPKLRKS